MVLTLPGPRKEGETEEEFSSRVQDFNPADEFLSRYTESTDPTETDFSVEAYEGDKGRGFFSPDGQGRPDEVAAEYGGAKGKLKREVEAFGKQFPIRTTDTPVDRPLGRGMGDRWEGPLSSDWRPRTVEVGRIASTGPTRGLLGGRREPSYRPTSANPEGQSGASASRLGGRTGGRQQFVGSRPVGTRSTFNTPSSANPNQTGPLSWWNKGRNVNVPNESTASWGDLWRDNQRQAGQSNQNYQQGKKPGFFGRPDRSVLGVDIPESIKNRRVVTVPPEKGGPGSGPTPLVRQIGERILGPVATGASIFAQGQTGSNLYQAVESAADYVPGLRSDPETDIGKRTGDFLAEKAGDVKDWFVDKMGNIRKDEQARQIRQAGLGTDIQGNIVTENQRIKAADEFIAGVENWEPLTDQRTYEDIPEVRGGIVDGQWDANYQVAPAAKTETTNQVVSDVGTVNQFGEVVPRLGVEDGDDVAFVGLFGKEEKLTGPATTKNRAGANEATMILNGMGDRQKFIDKYGVTPSEYMNLPQAGTQGDQSFNVTGQEVAQVASAGDLSGLGVTNQPATVDLNQSTPLPPPPIADDFLDEYIPPSQPYDQQEPVGNYIKNEETGEIVQLDDAPIPGVLPSRQEISGDWKHVSTYRPSAQLQSLWRANEAATQRMNKEWNKGNPVVGFDLGPGMRASEKASKAFSDLQMKEMAAHQRLTPEQGGDYWAAPGESYNVPWGGFPQGTQAWVFQNNN